MSNAVGTYVFEWARVRKLVLKSIVGAVIAAAAIAIYAVIVGSFNILEGKLLVLVALFVAFTLMSLFDAEVVSKTHETFAFAGVVVNVYLLLGGVLKIMLSHGGDQTAYGYPQSEAAALSEAFWQWVLLVVIARAAIGLAMLVKGEGTYYRYNSLPGLIAGTNTMVVVLSALVSFMVLFSNIDYPDVYWRLIGIAVILVVLGMVLIPLIGRFFGERTRPRPVVPQTTFPGVQRDAERSHPIVTALGSASPIPNVIPEPTEDVAADTETAPVAAPEPASAPASVPPRRLAWPRFEDGTPLPPGPDGKPDYSALNQ